MNNTITKISSVEAVCLILIITINKLILNSPQKILSSCGSSSIINTIYISVIIIAFVVLIIKLYRNFTNYDIIDISNFVGGKLLRNIIAIILITYLFFISATLLRNFSEIIHSIYYSRNSIIFLLLFFIVVCVTSNFFGKSAIIKTNVLVAILIIFSLLIIFISVIPNVVIQRVFPLLGKGINETFFTGISNISSFNGLLCIYFIMPLLSEKKDFKKISIIGICLTSLLLILSVATLVLSLAYSNIETISPIYTLIDNSEFGNFIQHPESLFIFTWILSMFTYLNIVIMFIIIFLKKITNIKNEKIFIIPSIILIFAIALIPQNIVETHKFEELIYMFVAMPLVFIVLPAILLIGNYKHKKSHKNDSLIKINNREVKYE